MTSAEVFSGVYAESHWPSAVGVDVAFDHGGAIPRWVLSESGGDLVCTTGDGSVVTITLPAGVPVPLQIAAITAAGSSATDLLFLW